MRIELCLYGDICTPTLHTPELRFAAACALRLGYIWYPACRQRVSISNTRGSSIYPNFEGPPRAKPRSEVHLGDAAIAIIVTRRPNRYSGTPIASPLRASRTAMRSGTVANTLIFCQYHTVQDNKGRSPSHSHVLWSLVHSDFRF